MKKINITWASLARNAESQEISFETFTFQVAYAVFREYGDFEYDYNTPGSEFYLHLTRDCPALKAVAGQNVGWQAKFWVSNSDPANTSLDKSNRDELVEGFRKSLEYKKHLATWVICTPGQPINTKPHCPKDALVKELASVDTTVVPLFWNKPIYEAMLHEHHERLAPIYRHYFDELFIGRALCERRTQQTLVNLREKYDVELYVPGNGDDELWKLIRLDGLLDALKARFTALPRALEFLRNDHFNQPLDDRVSDRMNAQDSLCALASTLASDLSQLDDSIQSLRDAKRAFDIYRTQWPGIVTAYKNLQSVSGSSGSQIVLDYGPRQLLDDLADIGKEFRVLRQIAAHVVGSAGYGKTCLACYVADKCLKEKIPVILLTGRMLSASSPMKDQIVSALDLPSEWTLRDVFSCLNNLGFLCRKKIPFIIDGLNETVPDCSRWLDDIKEIAALSREFPHVLLVTTVRNAYCERVHGFTSADDVPHHIILQGFTDFNIEYAVKKYFDKFHIATTNWSVSHKIFAHPLLLKMFCVVNADSSVEITHVSVFSAIEKYVDMLVGKAAARGGDTNRFLRQTIKDRLCKLGCHLWEVRSRSINYLSELPRILDPDWDGKGDWQHTITCKLLDEGLLLSREIRDGNEVAEFSYDMVAGVVIAKSVFFDPGTTPATILASHEALERLGDSTSTSCHPFAEDITRALIYLWPKYCGGTQLIEATTLGCSVKLSFEMLDVICATASGRNAVRTVLMG